MVYLEKFDPEVIIPGDLDRYVSIPVSKEIRDSGLLAFLGNIIPLSLLLVAIYYAITPCFI